MLARLSDFLRATLDRTETDEIPLADEIEFACQYLEIEEIRFGDRLRVEISVGADAEDALVPPLILQPLVENAVRHGVAPREGGGAIAIVAEREADWLTLGVHDDGPGSRVGGPGERARPRQHAAAPFRAVRGARRATALEERPRRTGGARSACRSGRPSPERP